MTQIDRRTLDEVLDVATTAAIRARRLKESDATVTLHVELADALIEAARAHRDTLPKTKMIDVWHVAYALTDGHRGSFPAVNVYTSMAAASSAASGFQASLYQCVRITGPHKQEVPA
jgi:hypothetical protein